MSRPQLMGILNLTPDSFSGDGALSVQDALARFEALVAEGASVIDLGAESTRPGATPLNEADEWARLSPVLTAILQHPQRDAVTISIDSYHAGTMRRALEMGVGMANDVTGLRADAMAQVLADRPCDIVVMHSLTVPADPEITWEPTVDAVAEILRWKQAILARAAQVGIDPTRVIFDPGLGFGKTPQQSLALIQRADELVASGGRWLLGHSRKSFLRWMAQSTNAKDRDDATLMASAMLAQSGVHLLRVHAVGRHRAMMDALC